LSLNKESSKKRGAKELHSIEKLKELAFQVKEKYKGKKITPLLLQRETKIGRMTWTRKIGDFIDKLNGGVNIQITLTPSDEVYLPKVNLSVILETYEHDKVKLMNELINFQSTFDKIYDLLVETQDTLNKYKTFKHKYETLLPTLEKYKTQAHHYETLYKKLLVSSAIPHLRDELGIKENLLQFNKNNENKSLKSLHTFFPDVTNENQTVELQSQINLEFLNKLAPGFLKEE
jgi:hypothetical protein